MGRYKPKQGFQPPTQSPQGMSSPSTPGSYQPPQQQGMPQQYGQPPQSQYNPQDWPTTFPKPMVGFDRDGVVIEWKNVIKRFEDITYIPGSLEAIRQLRLKGHKAWMFADQPNISRGLMTDNDVQNIHRNMMNHFGQSGIFSIDGFLYNQSDMPQDHYAKPNIGMLNRSKNEMHMDWTDGYYVGDTIEDVKMAQKFGVKPILVRTGKGAKTEKDHLKGINTKYNDVQVFDNLLEFVNSL
jgi:D-glycero-D-manno-heptose 1,7-bisphosphate phosphatase